MKLTAALSLASLLAACACHDTGESDPPATTCAPATTTMLDTSCLGAEDGAPCCFGAEEGTCQASECVVSQP